MEHATDFLKQGTEMGTTGITLDKKKLTGWARNNRTGQLLFILAIIVAITVTEWVFVYQNVAYGIGLALFMAIAVYLVISTGRLNQHITDSAESLVLIPLYILFTSSLPWFFINQQYLLPAVYSIIIALCLWHIYHKKLSLRELGFTKKNWPKYVLLGLALGIPVGSVEYFILHPAPAFPTFEIKYLLRDMLYMFGFVGLGEELLFRALVQRDLTKAFGFKLSLFLTSVTFAVMHLTWRSMPELAFVFVASLLLGYLYHRTKSLVAPIVLHGTNNVILVAVMPYILNW
ncbi:lysostaphin resistance A-like protein [Chloroflexota bacterium]